MSGTATQKAAYYNQLLSQGYTDEQIRTAIGAPLDSNWLLLQQIAQQQSAGSGSGGGGGGLIGSNMQLV